MKNFTVSFGVESHSHTLEELSSLMGMPAHSGSYEKGKMRGGSIAHSTVWKMFSQIVKSAPLEEHLDSILKATTSTKVFEKGLLPDGCKLVLNIAVFYDTVDCTIGIGTKFLSWLAEHKINLEVASYPLSFDT